MRTASLMAAGASTLFNRRSTLVNGFGTTSMFHYNYVYGTSSMFHHVEYREIDPSQIKCVIQKNYK